MFIRSDKLVSLLSKSPQATRKLGRRLGELVRGGDVIYLYGEIGAGKTVFTSGIASALGINEYITSPTYTIANEYRGVLPLYHFDAYRIKSPDELLETGFYDYSGGGGVVVAEWAENIQDADPTDCIQVWIDAVDGFDNRRTVKILFPSGNDNETNVNHS